ncbi:SurA N-terminal domain-containing protein [Halanaerobium hydrogeniformans]|uniref:peptidylprolyl isomerase n=1 Tax=Halanaerobium hydrogeniformans TaxID=656519 RepID=E4RP22_HALHG|nr:SurA N-terminal domain-containing protein [Halanaerobium hydrogeniformans]ADQ13847.1 peptidil-prolyl cis-trans isomerase [Halanaerobium hydrogeniformans]
MKKILVSLLIITVLIVPTSVFAQEMDMTPEEPVDSSIEEDIGGNIVAEVNGEEITDQELAQQANVNQLLQEIAQIDQQLAQVLVDSESGNEVLDEFQKLKLDALIDNVLLSQQAEELGIELTDEEVDEIYQAQKESIKQQNDLSEEDFLAVLENQGFESEEEYKQAFADNPSLKVNKLIEQEVLGDFEISEEELLEEYEANEEQFTQGGETIPFEQIKPQLEQMMMQQRQNDVINDYIEGLRDDAEIEIMI